MLHDVLLKWSETARKIIVWHQLEHMQPSRLSDFFEHVKKYKSTSGQKLDRKVQFFEFM